MSAYGPDCRWYGALNVRYWGNSGHAVMSTAGSLNELLQKNSSDTAFTNSDAGANGASDAAGNNMARRTVHGWQLCSDAQSPVGLRCRESAAADQNAGGERGN